MSGESRPGTKVDAIESFSKNEVKDLEIALDHKKTIEDAFTMINRLR